MKRLLLSALLLLSVLPSLFAQRVAFDKKAELIVVDGAPAFYLKGTRRVVFQSDFALENLKHRELAYLKVMQQRIFSPLYGYTTETFYIMTFAGSGNYCEIHGLPGFSMFKALGKYIAASRLIRNDEIDPVAERRFIRMNYGFFRKGESRDRPDAQQDRESIVQEDWRNNSRNNRADDPRNTYGGRPPRNNRDTDDAVNTSSSAADVSIENNRIYDKDVLVGTYTQQPGQEKGAIAITISNAKGRKVATARRANTTSDWEVKTTDGALFTLKYNRESPLVGLFTSLVERQYL